MALAVILYMTACKPSMPDTENIELQTRMDTISYIIGLDYGAGIREEKIKANQLAIYKGLVDGLENKTLLSDSVKNFIIDELYKSRVFIKCHIFSSPIN